MEELNENIVELLNEKKYLQIAKLVKDLNPADAAIMIEEIPEDKMPIVFRLLSKELAADAFAYMNTEAQELLIHAFSDKELDDVVSQLFVDDTVDMIEEMPANVVKRILRHVDNNVRKSINEILNYPRDSAGSMMTVEYVDLKRSMTVEQAFDRIRKTGVDKETVYTCYVTDNRRKLEGVVTVRELLLAPKDEIVDNIMETNTISVNTHTDQEIVARELSKYDFLAIPVVDNEERLVGIVTVDDAIDVMVEETTEDIEKMAAMTPSEGPYMKTGVIETWKQRVPWLLVLMISATFTSIIISSFESALAAVVVLTTFIPMLMNSGGNAGSQTSTSVIRAISLGEVGKGDIFKIIRKELMVAFVCGFTMAVANFIKLIVFDQVGVMVALVVSITLIGILLIANTMGCCMPILAKKIGFDPAVMSSPFISTVVDSVSLLVYFNVAVLILNI